MSHDQPIAVEVHDLTVAYHRRPVLWGVDFTLPAGHLIGLIGPNGAGKSTLLKAMLNMVPAASGWVKIYGKPYAQQKRLVGYVPQRESVDWDFPINVLDVVLMGRYGHLGLLRRPRRSDYEFAMACLEQVGMADYSRRQISQLSGGQQQRVAVARALVGNPSLILADEPTGNLDLANGDQLMRLLDSLHADGATLITVTHNPAYAERASRRLQMFDGQLR